MADPACGLCGRRIPLGKCFFALTFGRIGCLRCVERHDLYDEVTDLPVEPDVGAATTAGDLIDAEMCTGQCLLGRCAAEDCDCRCGGRFHGIARGALVEAAA